MRHLLETLGFRNIRGERNQRFFTEIETKCNNKRTNVAKTGVLRSPHRTISRERWGAFTESGRSQKEKPLEPDGKETFFVGALTLILMFFGVALPRILNSGNRWAITLGLMVAALVAVWMVKGFLRIFDEL